MITVCNKSNHLRQNKMLQNSFHLHPICYTFTGPLCLVAREVLQIHGQAIRKGRTAHFSSKPGHVGLHCETAREETCYHLLFLFILPSDSFFFFLNVGRECSTYCQNLEECFRAVFKKQNTQDPTTFQTKLGYKWLCKPAIQERFPAFYPTPPVWLQTHFCEMFWFSVLSCLKDFRQIHF